MPIAQTNFWQQGDGNPLNVQVKTQNAAIAYTTTATITPTELTNGLLTYTGAGHTLTLPLATDLETLLTGLTVGATFEFSVNATTGIATIATNTGWTLQGTMTVAAGAATRFRVRKTALNAYTLNQVA